MTLREVVERYNNLVSLVERNDIPRDLLEESIQALEQELIEKVVNILEYRKELIQEEKTQKKVELEEYLQYYLYIARIDKLELDKTIIEVNKESINIKELSI